MTYKLPTEHLDAAFETAVATVRQFEGPASNHTVVASLRRSLRSFIRREFSISVEVTAASDRLPPLLRKHIANGFEPDPDALDEFIRLRASQWRDTIVELVNRLGCDWANLCEHFGVAQDAAITAVTPPLGDLHHGGRAVHKLTFSDGTALIYKPRSVETEHLFRKLLESLEAEGCTPAFRSCAVLPRNGYGWTEFVATTYCQNYDEIVAFYRRQGGFLALFWLLCAGDAIGENVVVAGEHPIWVDTECLCSPDLIDLHSGHLAFPEWIRESMLGTAMVLYGGGDLAQAHFRGETGLYVSCTQDRTRTFTNDDVLQPPFLQAVTGGFRDLYQWFLDQNERRSLKTGLLAGVHSRNVRVLLRSTALYADLVRLIAVTPRANRSEVLQDIRQALSERDARGSGPFPDGIVSAEIEALERGDIPYWVANTMSLDLWEANGERVYGVSRATCVECIERRLARMSAADLSRQMWLLESFLSGSGNRGRNHDDTIPRAASN
jgi:lantibiotic modifying enzyme